jgi:hypothetical protein
MYLGVINIDQFPLNIFDISIPSPNIQRNIPLCPFMDLVAYLFEQYSEEETHNNNIIYNFGPYHFQIFRGRLPYVHSWI